MSLDIGLLMAGAKERGELLQVMLFFLSMKSIHLLVLAQSEEETRELGLTLLIC